MKHAGYSEEGCGRGRRVLVHAGAGGVGHFALQLARLYGFDEVVTTCSAGNADFVQSLGATTAVAEDGRVQYGRTASDQRSACRHGIGQQ